MCVEEDCCSKTHPWRDSPVDAAAIVAQRGFDTFTGVKRVQVVREIRYGNGKGIPCTLRQVTTAQPMREATGSMRRRRSHIMADVITWQEATGGH